MAILKRYLKLTLLSAFIAMIITFVFNHFFNQQLQKDLKAFHQDTQRVQVLTDTYSLGCNTKDIQETKECKELNEEIKTLFIKLGSDQYATVGFYLKYLAK